MDTGEDPNRDAVAGLSSLDDPARRRLYDYVAACDEPVSREQAAAGAGIGRSLAAYHLDKLAGSGLLDVGYARPPGRGGPGGGARQSATPAPSRDSRRACRPAVTGCWPPC